MFEHKRRARGSLLSLGLFLAVCLVGNLTGFAAGTPVNPARLGAGSGVVAPCQPSPLVATYEVGYDASLDGYAVMAVRFTGIDTTGPVNCAGRAFVIALGDPTGGSIAEGNGTAPHSGSTFSVDFSGMHVPVASVATLHVSFP